MRHIGFSTGAVAGGDFSSALTLLASQPGIDSIELSALRLTEVEPLLRAIPSMDLNRYSYISFHAPSSFPAEEEASLVAALTQFIPKEWPIVLHPDTIHDASLWSALGNRVAIENMDRRKPTGRTAGELRSVYSVLPDARLCFDIGHARQCDTSMAESYRILEAYGWRLAQLHVSEVNSASQHDPITYGTKLGFQSIAHLVPAHVPLIIESRVSQSEISKEINTVLESLPLFAETAVLQATCPD
jgi:hypothetical protein